MNDRLKAKRRANASLRWQQPSPFRRSSVVAFGGMLIVLGVLVLVFGEYDVLRDLLHRQALMGKKGSLGHFSRSLSLPAQAGSDLLAPGFFAVLSAVEYARILARPGSEIELVYSSSDHSEYVIFGDVKERLLQAGVSESQITPNYRVQLQGLESVSFGPDPREHLQWHHHDWSKAGSMPFPLHLDQQFPALLLQRESELGHWFQASGLLRSFVPANGCPGELPLTVRSSVLQDVLAEELGVQGRALDDIQPLVVHDSLPDLGHSDVVGQLSFLVREDLLRGGAPDEHGTHTAGLIGAARNRSGVAGIFPGVNMSFKLLEVGYSGETTLRQLIPSLQKLNAVLLQPPYSLRRISVALLNYAVEVEELRHGAPLRVVMNDLLKSSQTLFVVPSGNRSVPQALRRSHFLPAEFAAAMGLKQNRGQLFPVGASDVCSGPAWFSNRVEHLNGRAYHAPGQSVYSTLPHQDYGYMTGTSSAAAVAAGFAQAAAVLTEVSSAFDLAMTLRSSSSPLGRSDRDFILDSARFLGEHIRATPSRSRGNHADAQAPARQAR